MIRLAEAPDKPDLEEYCRKESPYACRIWATARAYGFHLPFARFWMQVQEGAVTAAVCKLDGAAVLEAGHTADFEELKGFLRAADISFLLCSAEACAGLKIPAVRQGRVMVSWENLGRGLGQNIEWNPGIREIYALLRDCRSDLFPVPDFEPFYLDLSHRIRHGTACSAGIRKDGELAACAVASHLTDNAAVVSAVAVRPLFRRQGLGTDVVRALLSGADRESGFVFRAEGENEAFYGALGFSDCGGWAELMLT